jgi:hypothetical protein
MRGVLFFLLVLSMISLLHSQPIDKESFRLQMFNQSFQQQDKALTQFHGYLQGFNMQVWMGNMGCMGINNSGDGTTPYGLGLEYPQGSGIEHLYGAAPWVGALVDTSTSGTPRIVKAVTTGYEGWSGPLYEFYGNPDGSDSFFVTSILSSNGHNRKGVDDDGDGLIDEDELDGKDNDNDGLIDEDYGALSENDAYVSYADYYNSPRVVGHVPLGIKVFQKSYSWGGGSAADAIIMMEYEIINVQGKHLNDVYVGFFADADVGPRNVGSYFSRNYSEYSEKSRTAYAQNPVDRPSTPMGISVIGTPKALSDSSMRYTFQWYPGSSSPIPDINKYDFMSSGIIEPSEYPSISDTRFFFSFGPFDSLRANDTLKIVVALVSGGNVFEMENNARRAKRIYESGYFVMPVTRMSVGDNGKSAVVFWDSVGRSPYGEVVGYRVYHGTTKEQFSDSITTTGYSYEFTNLDTTQSQYFGVAALDDQGNRGAISSEVKLSVADIPPPIVEFNLWYNISIDTMYILDSLTSSWHGINISYRGMDHNSSVLEYSWRCDSLEWKPWSSSRTAVISGTDVIDPENRIEHLIEVRARNEWGVETPVDSIPKLIFHTYYPDFARPGYQKKMLFINIARGATVSTPSNPDRTTITNFYKEVLDSVFGVTDTSKRPYDIWNISGHPKRVKLSEYSTVFIAQDNFNLSPQTAYKIPGALYSSYMDVGGNIILTGLNYWVILQILEDSQDLLVNHMHIASIYYPWYIINRAYDCIGANGFNGYPSVAWDPVKLDTAWKDGINNMAVAMPLEPGEIIYTYDSKTDSVDFEGKMMGVRYLGPEYKSVYYGFPLYYVQKDQAVSIVRKSIEDIGGMTVGVSENKFVPLSFYLGDAYPNPFNPSTKIRYSIPQPANITLRIYDILGREITALVNEKKMAGEYTAQWNAGNYASGVYFYRLEAIDANNPSHSFTQVKKMLLLK